MRREARLRGWGGSAAMAALGLVFCTVGLGAQERGRVTAEGRAGAAFPIGELADIADAGPSFGAGVAYFLHPNIGIGGDLQVSLLSSSSPDPFGVIRTSDVTLTSFGAGLILDFPRPAFQDEPLSFRARILNGLTVMSAGENVDFSETYYTLNAGGRFGYQVSSKLEVFVGTDFYMVVTRAEDTAAFFQGPNSVEPMTLAMSIPVTIGVQARVR